MGDRKSITILHLSDIQYGKNHRFGRRFDSLLTQLTGDLKNLRDKHELTPDLIIATGSLPCLR